MKILGVDFETTGLSWQDDRIIEVGAVLYDWQTETPLRLYSQLVNPGRPLPAAIVALTGITDELIATYGQNQESALYALIQLIEQSDFVMAHNGSEFDKLFFDSWIAQVENAGGSVGTGWERPWLDTRCDIVFPEAVTTRNLKFLAAEHGFLNPFAHRAVFDVLTMLKVARQYPLEAIVARSKEPTLYIQAVVSFDDKDKAKARGYFWCAPRKIWWRSIKQSDYVREQAECGFRTSLLSQKPE
jgi:DNA polymerase-3 subunit epsilon